MSHTVRNGHGQHDAYIVEYDDDTVMFMPDLANENRIYNLDGSDEGYIEPYQFQSAEFIDNGTYSHQARAQAGDDDIVAGADDRVVGGMGDDDITIDPLLTEGTGTILVGGDSEIPDSFEQIQNHNIINMNLREQIQRNQPLLALEGHLCRPFNACAGGLPLNYKPTIH